LGPGPARKHPAAPGLQEIVTVKFRALARRVAPRRDSDQPRLSKKKRVALGFAAGAMVAVPAVKDALPPYEYPDTARQTPGLVTTWLGIDVSKETCERATAFSLDPDHAFKFRLTPEGLVCGHAMTDPMPQGMPSTVSGGPGSAAPWGQLGSKGRQFLSDAIRAQDIAKVYPQGTSTKEPIRAYVGIHHPGLQTPKAQAQALFDELERLGAFDRAFLHIAGTTGSGGSNRVTLGAMEYLTRGDIASGAIQVNDSRSIYSYWQAEEGRLAYFELFQLIHGELEARAAQGQSVPKLVVTGESMGAWQIGDAMLEFDQGHAPEGFGPVLLSGNPGDSAYYQQILELTEAQRRAQGIALLSDVEDLKALPEDIRIVLFNNPGDHVVGFKLEAHPRMFGNLQATIAAATVGESFELQGHEYRVATPEFERTVLARYGVTVADAEYDAILATLLERERA
jgi:hypothetical protein